MTDEAETGLAGASDGRRHPEGGRSEPAPLQARAHFLQNWDWLSVTHINRGLCERGKAQRGINSETHEAVAEEWEKARHTRLTLLETFRFLRSCHKRAPFLFFNGNTFAEIARALSNALFADLSLHRRKQASSAAAHYVTGVLAEDMMIGVMNELCLAASFAPGDRVKTLRGTTHGVIVRIEEDGRVAWRPDGTESELLALPESLLRER